MLKLSKFDYFNLAKLSIILANAEIYITAFLL